MFQFFMELYDIGVQVQKASPRRWRGGILRDLIETLGENKREVLGECVRLALNRGRRARREKER